MSKDDPQRKEDPDTLPPPPGADDAYSAETRVTSLPESVLAALRAQNLRDDAARAADLPAALREEEAALYGPARRARSGTRRVSRPATNEADAEQQALAPPPLPTFTPSEPSSNSPSSSPLSAAPTPASDTDAPRRSLPLAGGPVALSSAPSEEAEAAREPAEGSVSKMLLLVGLFAILGALLAAAMTRIGL